MRTTLRSTRPFAALLMGLALVVAACGGSGSGDDAADAGGESTTAPIDSSATGGGDTLPPVDAPEAEFTEVDGSQARFVNLMVLDGEGIDVDVYWGMSADTGKLASTVSYGEVSDWMPIEVESNPVIAPSDGSTSSRVAFYPAGEREMESLLMTEDETIDGDVSFTYALGWSETFDSSTSPATVGLGYEHDAVEAPDGQAWVALSTIGVGGIEDGDFLTLNSATGCGDLIQTDLGGGTANAGLPTVLDAGPTEITASDANSDCSFKTPAVSLELAAGDRYILFAYGTDLADRQLLPVKLGD